MALTEEQRNPWRAIVAGGDYNLTSQDWEDLLTELDSLYTEAPIAQPASAPEYVQIPSHIESDETGEVIPFDSGEIPDGFTALFRYCQPASAPSEKKPVYQFRPECENWIDCTEQFYESWRGEKRELYTAPQPYYKAQRDALLKSLGAIKNASQSAVSFHDLRKFAAEAIASVKGGA